MDKSNLVVLLDNGHGDNTPGKRSPILENGSRLFEWSYTREIVKLIAEELKSRGISYRLIHPEDSELESDLKLRVLRANWYWSNIQDSGKEMILVSVHVNAAGKCKNWSEASGWQVYVCKKASDKSISLAKSLYKEASRLNLMGNRYIPKDQVWRNNYYILSNTKMPAILTENMFMDNKQDVDFLLSEEGKNSLVEVHVLGIENYIKNL